MQPRTSPPNATTATTLPETILHLIMDYTETEPGYGLLQALGGDGWQKMLENYCGAKAASELIEYVMARELAPALLKKLDRDIAHASLKTAAKMAKKSRANRMVCGAGFSIIGSAVG